MALLDDINRLLRDHTGYTGDGQGGRGDLPVGDRSTARYSPAMRDLRELMKTIAQTLGDPGALANLQQQIGEAGRVYASRAAAVSAAASLPTAVTHMFVREGTALVIRSRTASADDPLFDTGARWGVVQRQDSVGVAALTLPRLTNVGGTPDAITADLPAGASPVVTGSFVLFRPTTTNTAANPTLTIGGGFTRTLQTETGGTLAAGRLVPDTFHLINIASNGAARVIGIFVRPGELPGIRDTLASVSAQASTLATTVEAVAVKPVLEYALQTGVALPVRPNAPVVHWLTWSDPTTLMAGPDMWFKLPEPTVPDMPASSSWRFLDARSGTQAVLRIVSLPNANPPLTGLQYRLDGGDWVSVPVAVGDVIINGLTKGQSYTPELRYLNFVGAGIPGTAPAVAVTDSLIGDTFDRANGPVSNDSRWIDIVIGGNGRKATIISNAAQPSGANELFVVQSTQYSPPDQLVEAQVLGTGANTTSPRGVLLYARMPTGQHSGYRLRLAGSTWALSRVTSGTAVTLASGSHGNTAPYQARLTVVGTTLTVRIANVIVATFTDTDPGAFLAGSVGFGFFAAGADGASSVRLDNFVAGAA